MTQRLLSIPAADGWHACNPSIAAANDGFRMLVRVTNYRISPQAAYQVHPDHDNIASKSVLVSLRPDLSPRWIKPASDVEAIPASRVRRMFGGYEDGRLFHDGVEWRVLAATWDWNSTGRSEQAVLRLDGTSLVDPIIISASANRHERNWMPAVSPSGVRLIASCAPTVVHSLLSKSLHREPIVYAGPAIAQRFRGGSQAIPFDGGWLAVVHEIALRMDGRRIYRHRWVWFDADWRLTSWSKSFSFRGEDFEFCAGLAPMGNDALVASFGVWDREVWLDVRPLDDVRASLRRATRYAEATCCSSS